MSQMFYLYFLFTLVTSIDGSTQGNDDLSVKFYFDESYFHLVCNGPLGMTSGEIRDWQITASSTLWDPDCHEKNARLYQSSDRAWCPRQKSDSEWLQIDSGISAKVS